MGSAQTEQLTAYGAIGNVTAITHQDHTQETVAFTYNALNALASVAGASGGPDGPVTYTAQGRSVDIGSISNLWERATNTGTCSTCRPPSHVGAQGYTDDNNGNRIADPSGLGFTYDGENHLLSLTSGPTTVFQNIYDGDGNRVVRYDRSGQTTHFIAEWYEFNVTTGIATAYYPFNGRPIAMKQGSTLSYLHHDHLGSLVAAADPSGSELGNGSWARYSPFGQLRLSGGSLPSDRLFTGQTRDNVLGAGNADNDAYYFFKARYYDATIGQFQSADIFVLSMFDAGQAGRSPLTASYTDARTLAAYSQSLTAVPGQPWGLASAHGSGASIAPHDPHVLNRYAYALNNPLKYADGSGHIAWLVIGAGAVIGALVGGGGYVAASIATGHHMTVGEAAVAIGVGATAGALAPIVAVTTVGAAGLGVAANVAQYGLTQVVNHDSITTIGLGLAAATGAIGGLFAGRIDPESVDAVAGNAFRRSVAPETDRIRRMIAGGYYIGDQLKNLPRSLSGSFISNGDYQHLLPPLLAPPTPTPILGGGADVGGTP